MDLLSQTALCGSNACGDVAEQPDGSFLFTSTLGDDSGRLTLTAEETAQLFDDIKAGTFDKMHDRARAIASQLV